MICSCSDKTLGIGSLIDDCGFCVDLISRGVGGLVDDHGVLVDRISHGIGGLVDNRGFNNMISSGDYVKSTICGVDNNSTSSFIGGDLINPHLFAIDQSDRCISIIVTFGTVKAPSVNVIQDSKNSEYELSVAGAVRDHIVPTATAKKRKPTSPTISAPPRKNPRRVVRTISSDSCSPQSFIENNLEEISTLKYLHRSTMKYHTLYLPNFKGGTIFFVNNFVPSAQR